MMTNNQSSSIFLKSKEEAIPHILTWLGRTYQEKPGSMLLKKDVHAAYSAFCAEHRFETTTNAAFGKMFKRVFPSAEVRRLVKHNETTFFYENMTAQSVSGKAPVPQPAPSPSPRNGNGSPRRSPGPDSTSGERRPRREGSTYSPNRRRATANSKEKGRLGSGVTNKRRSVKSEEEEEDGTEAERELHGQKGCGREERIAVRPEWASAAVSVPVGGPQLASWTSDAQLGFTDTLHRFCQLYRHEMWGFWPINPSMVEYSTLSYIFNTDHGAAERSALSVAAHFIVSVGYLLLGDVTHGREFFWKAREHLSYVFDSSNYDVACLLKHMSWAALLFSGTGSEGHDRETYYLSLCKNICQRLGAENDGLYLGTLKVMAIRDRTTSYEGEIQKALCSPHYANGWQNTGPLATHAQFNEHFTARLLESYRNIVLLTEAFRQGTRPPSQVYRDFAKELQEIQRYEDGFIQIYGESPPPRVCGIHVSCLLVCRAIIFNHLNNHGAVLQHLRGLVQHFSRIDAASVAIVITEFGSRGLFWREVVSVMLQHQLYDQLGQLCQIVHPLRQHFYWINAEMSQLEKAMGQGHFVHEPCPPLLPLPSLPSAYQVSLPRDQPPRSPSPLFPYPYAALAVPTQLPDFREALDLSPAEDQPPNKKI